MMFFPGTHTKTHSPGPGAERSKDGNLFYIPNTHRMRASALHLLPREQLAGHTKAMILAYRHGKMIYYKQKNKYSWQKKQFSLCV